MITLPRRPAPAATPPRTGPRLPWITATVGGLSVLLAGAPVGVIVAGTGWIGYAVGAAVAVVASGLLLHRFGVPVVAAGQCVAVLMLLTALFTDDGVLGVLPGPAAAGRIGELINGAGQQISVEIAPVPETPEILVLVTAAFGLLGVAVHLAAVSASAPAAAGVPLLAVFAIPAALADNLLPAWAVVPAAAGYGLLLLTGDGTSRRPAATTAALRRLPAASALITTAVLLALGIGAGAGVIGTAGRFAGGAGAGGSGGSIGLSPFTSLRGQLDDSGSVELMRVRGLGRASYLRALTLSEFVPDTGWRATTPAPGTALPGPVQRQPATPGEVVDVQVENVAFRDYWLPLYGEPLEVTGIPDAQWAYEPRSGTGYTIRPRQDGTWRERTLLPRPTADALRQAGEASRPPPGYRTITGVDPRVIELARQLVAGRDNEFDQAIALQDFFTGPDSRFRYSLQTAPGNGDDALVEFLTVGRTGYCEQFASAMAVMLRAVGIAARVAVGFTGGTDFGEYRSIRTSDAHAWVEAYFPGAGWVTFDPTPLTDGRTITPDYVLEARGEAVPEVPIPSGELGPGRLPDNADAPAPAPPVELPSADPAAAAPGPGSGWTVWPLLAIALLVAAALSPAGFRRRQRRRRLAAAAAGGSAAAVAGWQELLAESTDRDVGSPASDTVRAAARRMVREHRLGPDAQQALRQLIGAVEASWYGGRHPDPGELSGPVQLVRTAIAAGSPLSASGRLWPRSVLAGTLRSRSGAAGPTPGPKSTTAAHRN
jgi:TgpA N-terminal domain/Transglutaminase-like superfamily/Domain of unknown function (DUF4129)